MSNPYQPGMRPANKTKPAMLYSARVVEIIDGDTMDLEIDVGFGIRLWERIRLAEVDTCETRTRDLSEKHRGLAERDYLFDILHGGKGFPDPVHIHCEKRGKFGRWIAHVWFGDIHINKAMFLYCQSLDERMHRGRD